MKASIIILVLLYSLTGSTQRYLTDDFPVLDSIIGSTYGNALDYQSNNQELLFDFYEPANDVNTKRPLIIYLHGGGFNSGTRSYPSVQQICRRMANKGYAVANIDYRLDPGFDLYNSNMDRRAMTDAMHDAKQAIRYFKSNATTYGIDTSLIFIGGESAGAIISMMASFVDKQSEMNIYPLANPNDPVGSQSNPNVGNDVKGTLCLCGLILDTLAIELPTDPSILWTHGTNDNLIPIALAFNVVLRASNIGLPFQAKAYEGATHCPWYFGNPNWESYLDSTIVDITTFLYPQVSSTVGVNEANNESDISIYPNPFHDQINISQNTFRALNTESTVTIFSSLGEVVFEKTFEQSNKDYTIDLGNIERGYYFLLLENNEHKWVKKIVKSR